LNTSGSPGEVYKTEGYIYPDDSTNVRAFVAYGTGGYSGVSTTSGLTQDAWNAYSIYAVRNNSFVVYVTSPSETPTGTWYVDDFTVKRLTDCAATGALIVSTIGGSTRSWTSVDTGFNPNSACTYEIYDVTLTGLADNSHRVEIYDSAGKRLVGVAKEAGSGETLGSDILTNGDFSGTWGANDVPQGWDLLGTPNASNYLEKDDLNNRLRIVSDGALVGINQPYGLTVNALYKITWDIESFAYGSGKTTVSNKLNTETTSGVKTYYDTGFGVWLYINRDAACDFVTNSLSVEPVTAPSTDGIVIVNAKGGATENFLTKDAGFTYNAASYTIIVKKLR
jgi:hypothetical protein